MLTLLLQRGSKLVACDRLCLFDHFGFGRHSICSNEFVDARQSCSLDRMGCVDLFDITRNVLPRSVFGMGEIFRCQWADICSFLQHEILQVRN
jgi:hypothetical protein